MARRRFLEKYNGRKLEWLHDSLAFIVMAVCAIILFRFIIGFSIVGGDSMEPNLSDGEFVLYNRLVLIIKRVIRSPCAWLQVNITLKG